MGYQKVIIGAGLSGIAAGIRLSHYNEKVLILESHSIAGGLNSYYKRGGHNIDVGLHAMTNFSPVGSRGTPLTKLFRQLRIRQDEFRLVEQHVSVMDFPDKKLNFSNDTTTLSAEIKEKFPEESHGFEELRQRIKEYDSTSLDNTYTSAKEIIQKYINDTELIDMLLCPVMFYGNAQEYDMDWTDFTIIWDSIFESGFCRPEYGMEYIIKLLLEKYAGNGGEIRYNSKVKKLTENPDKTINIYLENGEIITADQVFSSARYVETSALCGIDRSEDLGKVSFCELICYLDTRPKLLGSDKSIIFYSRNKEFTYKEADTLIDTSSGVICLPDNFNYPQELPAGVVRVAIKANYTQWAKLSTQEYKEAKDEATAAIIETVKNYLPDVEKHITFTDLFTPKTINRYTNHIGGSIYGSPKKNRNARMDFENLFLIGTDQGYLGIVGSLLSGISIANKYGL